MTNEGDSLACLACGVDIGVGGSGKEVFIVDVACKKDDNSNFRNPSFSISISSLKDSWNNRGLTCNNGWGEARPSLVEEAAILDKCKILLQICILVSLNSIQLNFMLFMKNSYAKATNIFVVGYIYVV